jgi:hypothetical protein
MKQAKAIANRLCSSCRKRCKQPTHAVIASCPSYVPLPRDLRSNWVQMEFKFAGRK